MSANILIIDDEPKLASILKRVLVREGYNVDITYEPEKGVGLMKKNLYDVILCDLKMPRMDGIEVLKHAKRIQKDADFIMMTAYATVETAVESMKRGAFDYLIKPFPIDELKLLLKRVLETKALKGENRQLKQVLREKFQFENVIAESEAMRRVLRRASKVARSDVSVLLRGESGTGKEVLAKVIHTNSRRSHKALVIVNCGAIPENLLESELFGHVKGAFTGAIESREGLFQTADGGSIFLDEVGELTPALQVKLLRVLQEGEFNRVGDSHPVQVHVRVIAATNRDLEVALEDGSFRPDLYYRLNVVPVYIPPLRQRREDIAPLIEHFLAKYKSGGVQLKIEPQAYELLQAYDWPGNVRELENAIEHAAVLCEGGRITVDDLPFALQNFSARRQEDGTLAPLDHLTLSEIEKRCIIGALKKTGGNQTKAARLLGITRRTLGYRMKKYDIDTVTQN